MTSTISPVGYDVVIVGGGAAGLSAALVLGRARRRVAMVDAGSPRNAPAAHMHGFPSRDGMSPADFLATIRAEVSRYGVDVITDRVEAIGPGFTIRLSRAGDLASRRVLIATGTSDELPDIPGVRERWGRDLLHCPYCHGWEVRDQPIGVLATRRDAVDHALLVRQWSADIVLLAHESLALTPDDLARLSARDVRVVTGEVRRLVVVADRLTGVELSDGRVVTLSAMFIRTHNVAHRDGLSAGLGCALDAGFPIVDGTGRTSVAGVWAAGNAVDPRALVTMAAGSGTAAAIAINADLVADDVATAMTMRRAANDSVADHVRAHASSRRTA